MSKKHKYPSHYTPGTHWALNEAWDILDQLKPDAIPMDIRSILTGLIAGTLMRNEKNKIMNGK